MKRQDVSTEKVTKGTKRTREKVWTWTKRIRLHFLLLFRKDDIHFISSKCEIHLLIQNENNKYLFNEKLYSINQGCEQWDGS